jgi:hypothetical protein
MKKDVHIYLDYELANKLESLAKKEHKKISNTYSEIIKFGFEQKQIQETLSSFEYSFKKIISNTNYTKSLLQKIYSINNNIKKFDNDYYTMSQKMND